MNFTITSSSFTKSRKNLKCSTNGWLCPSIGAVNVAVSAFVSTPLNFKPCLPTLCSTPLNPQKKSRCQYARRNSPSVTPFNPAAICFLTSSRISLSSTAVNSSRVISPFANFARASTKSLGRK